MNLFKWAKQQIAKAFEPSARPTPKPHAIHAAKAEAQDAVTKLIAEAKRRRNSPTQATRRKWTWFHIPKWWEKGTNKQGGHITIECLKTYNVGRNAAKRKARAGLSGKSARRLRIAARIRPDKYRLAA